MHIYFKNTASIFPEILSIYFTIFSCKQYDVITDIICIIEKRKKICQKEKRHSSVFSKAFQISRKYFSCHMHFKHFVALKWLKKRCINLVHLIFKVWSSHLLLSFWGTELCTVQEKWGLILFFDLSSLKEVKGKGLQLQGQYWRLVKPMAKIIVTIV